MDLFFVLSGYFIGGILIDQRDSPRLARTFYGRRAARILPLYYVTLGIYLAVGFAGFEPLHPAWVYSLFLTNLAFAWTNAWDSPSFSPLWSIAVEEQFYLVAPWVVRWLPGSRLPAFLLTLIGFAWLLRSGMYYYHPEKHLALHVLTPMRMDTLALGALLAWAVRNDARSILQQGLARTWPLWLGFSALLFLGLTACGYLGLAQVNAYGGFTLLAVIYALLVALIVMVRPPILLRLFSLRPLVLLGRYSYFIYLWHMLIGWGIIRYLGGSDFVLSSPRSLAIVLLAIGGTTLASVFSWKLLEQPMIKLGHRATY